MAEKSERPTAGQRASAGETACGGAWLRSIGQRRAPVSTRWPTAPAELKLQPNCPSLTIGLTPSPPPDAGRFHYATGWEVETSQPDAPPQAVSPAQPWIEMNTTYG